MSKFKRFISVLILAILVLQTAPLNGLFTFEDVKSFASSSEPIIELSFNKDKADVGDVIIAELKAKDVTNLACYQINLKYDPAVVQPVDETTGKPYGQYTSPKQGDLLTNKSYAPIPFVSNDLEKGYLLFGFSYSDLSRYKAGNIPESTGTLVKIGFKILKECDTSINFEDMATSSNSITKGVEVFDWDRNEINNVTINNSTIINKQYSGLRESVEASSPVGLYANAPDVNTHTLNAAPQAAADNITIEGYVCPDFSLTKGKEAYLKSGFKVEAYEGLYELSTKKTSTETDEYGYFKILDFNPDYSFKLRISKPGYLTRDYSSAINVTNGQIVIGSAARPELICAGDVPTIDSDNDGINDTGDNAVNMVDVTKVASMFNKAIDEKTRYFDLNADGYVNMKDIIILSNSFNKTSSSYPTSVKAITLAGDSSCKDLILDNTSFDLSGKNLKVGGNLVFRSTQEDFLKINGGSIDIAYCLNFGEPKRDGAPLQTPKLIMTNEADYIKIGGNFVFATDICHEGLLTAGTIEVLDNFNVNEASNSKAFYATGTHKLILSKANYSQNINLGNAPTAQNKINTLILTRLNTIDNYVFQPKRCWNSLVDKTEENINQEMDGSIDFGGDVDTFWFTSRTTRKYNIKSTGSTDTYLKIYDTRNNLIAERDDELTSENFNLDVPLSQGETYKLSVRHFDNVAGTGTYKLLISDVIRQPLDASEARLRDLAAEAGGTFSENDNTATVIVNGVSQTFDSSNSRIINNEIVVNTEIFEEYFKDVLSTPEVPATPDVNNAPNELASSYSTTTPKPTPVPVPGLGTSPYAVPTAPIGMHNPPLAYQIYPTSYDMENRSTNVKKIQELLIKLKCWFYPDGTSAVGKVSYTGYYGDITVYSIRRFQENYMNMASNGKVDAQTALELSKYNLIYCQYDGGIKPQGVKVREYLNIWHNIGYITIHEGTYPDGNVIGYKDKCVTLNARKLEIPGLYYASDEKKCYAHIIGIENALKTYYQQVTNYGLFVESDFDLDPNVQEMINYYSEGYLYNSISYDLKIADAIMADALKCDILTKVTHLRTKNYVDNDSDLKDYGFDGIVFDILLGMIPYIGEWSMFSQNSYASSIPEETLKIISEETNLAKIEREAASLIGRKYLVYEIYDLTTNAVIYVGRTGQDMLKRLEQHYYTKSLENAGVRVAEMDGKRLIGLDYAESRGLEAKVYEFWIKNKAKLKNKIRPMQEIKDVSAKVATKLQRYLDAATEFLKRVPK